MLVVALASSCGAPEPERELWMGGVEVRETEIWLNFFLDEQKRCGTLSRDATVTINGERALILAHGGRRCVMTTIGNGPFSIGPKRQVEQCSCETGRIEYQADAGVLDLRICNGGCARAVWPAVRPITNELTLDREQEPGAWWISITPPLENRTSAWVTRLDGGTVPANISSESVRVLEQYVDPGGLVIRLSRSEDLHAELCEGFSACLDRFMVFDSKRYVLRP